MIVALVLMAVSNPVVQLVESPPTGGVNRHYVGSRAPLAPTPFRKLPVGAVEPQGWIRQQLELQADGFIGHLHEISKFLDKKDNAWLSPTGEGVHGWEEVPYWLKGFGDTGYLLKDQRIVHEAKTWIEGVLNSQRADGYFGPQSNKVANKGAADVWPNMPMLNALQSYFEYSNDPRVLPFMSRYFKWMQSIPDEQMFLSYWEKHRIGDNLGTIFWLYNRTGEPFLLDLARKMHKNAANWNKGVADLHGVNFAQAFREPAQFSLLDNSSAGVQATERNYREMRRLYGQVSGGMYGADENARKGFDDPRQAAETCAMVEMMLSHEMLLIQTGDRIWAERCEDVAFNSLPASMTPDLKALRYLTAPNMPVSDAKSKSPGIQNGGPMYLMDPRDHRCCQHNVSHGWPYFAEHLWMASDGNGLAVGLYGPSTVRATVGDGVSVTFTETTSYPFEDIVRFTFASSQSVLFPLTLRVPSWSESTVIRINGEPQRLQGKGAWAIVDRTWSNGDVLEIEFSAKPKVQRLPKGAVSINRGPISYSLAIPEKPVVVRPDDPWAALELWPTRDWNFGIDPSTATFARKAPAPDVNPWMVESTPLEIWVQGRQIPEWQLDMFGLADILQQSPARSTSRVESLRLIPMGAARLRISAFPTVSPDGNPWETPRRPQPSLPASASHIYSGDTLAALSDGMVPKSSSDQSIPRFTWWDHKGSAEWVQYSLPRERTVSEASVYWFDDSSEGGGCKVPLSWRILYLDAVGDWVPVFPRDSYGVRSNTFNRVRFDPVTARDFRLEVQLRPGFSGGILEWKVR